jgi:SAM-dependent methyltransferase
MQNALQQIRNTVRSLIPQQARLFFRSIWQPLAWPFLLGSTYYCCCCNTSFRKFLYFYGKDNVRCPRCYSIDRYRLEWLYLKNRTDFFCKQYKVLHFAPEAVLSRKFKFMKNLDYTTADLMVSFMDFFCVRPDVIMDVENITFPDNTFDVVLCNHVLEHVPDDKKAMSEIFRVLKPGGWAMLQVPIDKNMPHTFEDPKIILPEDRLKHFGSPDHLRQFALDYKNRLEGIGFTVTVDGYVRELSRDIVEKNRLDINEDMYIVRKK